MATYVPPPPIYLPGEHLPDSAASPWACRSCCTPWPCSTASPYLTQGRCQCGSPTFWEKRLPRSWHIGPRCYSPADKLRAQAEEIRQYHQAHPHYPPARPPKPRRKRRQCPPFNHVPSGPGDVEPGTWLWVKPGGLHPGWGDIHRLAMLVRADREVCDVWVHEDGTLHRVKPHLLLLDTSVMRRSSSPPGRAPGGDSGTAPRWLRWTVADHLAHRDSVPGEGLVDRFAQQDLFDVTQLPEQQAELRG